MEAMEVTTKIIIIQGDMAPTEAEVATRVEGTLEAVATMEVEVTLEVEVTMEGEVARGTKEQEASETRGTVAATTIRTIMANNWVMGTNNTVKATNTIRTTTMNAEATEAPTVANLHRTVGNPGTSRITINSKATSSMD